MKSIIRWYSHSKYGPISMYKKAVENKTLLFDSFQYKKVEFLQSLHDQIQEYSPPPIRPLDMKPRSIKEIDKNQGLVSPDFAWIKSQDSLQKGWRDFLFSKFNKSKRGDGIHSPKGLYLYGSVGSGKTMLMDMFYDSLSNIHRRKRIHFHAFMQDIHKRVHVLRMQNGITSDPIPLIAAELVNESWILCFDEFQVTDISDAMIMRRLLNELFRLGLVMLTTSNRPPDDLYQNGIQRTSFLPTIELLKERCTILSLDSGIDYRKQDREQLNVYFTESKSGNQNQIRMNALFNKLIHPYKIESKSIPLWGRELIIPQYVTTANLRIAKMEFKDLCEASHSAADFLALSKEIDVLFLCNIPNLTLANRNEARRFIILIDTLYENKIKLIISAQVGIQDLLSGEPIKNDPLLQAEDRLLMDDLRLTKDQLQSSIFTGAEELFAFQRAVSRLMEMQSCDYLGLEFKNKVF